MLKAALFDLDGTLLDTLEDLTDAVNYVLGTLGYPLRTNDEIRSFLGYGAKYLVECSLPEGVDRADEILEEFKDYYAENCQSRTKPYDGILPLLRTLKARGIKIAIVSNKPDEGVQKLDWQYFEGVADLACGERAGIARKPAPDMVLAALKTLGVEAAEAVYIGDSEVDVQTAKNAGVPMIAVSWGFRSEQELRAAGAEVIAADPKELEALLLKM